MLAGFLLVLARALVGFGKGFCWVGLPSFGFGWAPSWVVVARCWPWLPGFGCCWPWLLPPSDGPRLRVPAGPDCCRLWLLLLFSFRANRLCKLSFVNDFDREKSLLMGLSRDSGLYFASFGRSCLKWPFLMTKNRAREPISRGRSHASQFAAA